MRTKLLLIMWWIVKWVAISKKMRFKSYGMN